LQGLAEGWKSRVSEEVSLPWLAQRCIVLRSRWCQNGGNSALVSTFHQGLNSLSPLGAHFAKAASRRGYAQLHPGAALWPRVEVKAPRAPRHPPSWSADRAEWGRKQRSCSMSSSTSLSGPSASAFHWQPGRDPCSLALAVLPHVRVAHGRQLTGGPQGRASRRVPAVEHYLGLLVG
jgi:hypothetical protein